MTHSVPRAMTGDDFHWAAELMARRRAVYEAYSPVFWRPAVGATDGHAGFLAVVAAGEGAVALRTEHGFVIATPAGGRLFVDDFAVEADDQWTADGVVLLDAVGGAATASGLAGVRVVTARLDGPKRSMLVDAGLAVGARWWVRELARAVPIGAGEPVEAGGAALPGPVGDTTFGPVVLGDVDALVIPAPPVYDPGGPVALLGDVTADRADAAADVARELGIVLVVVQRDGGPGVVADDEPDLVAVGFHNPSEFYDGVPVTAP